MEKTVISFNSTCFNLGSTIEVGLFLCVRKEVVICTLCL